MLLKYIGICSTNLRSVWVNIRIFLLGEGEEISSIVQASFSTFFQGEPNSQTRLIKVKES